MKVRVLIAVLLASAVAAGAEEKERLRKRFGPLYAKFGQGSTTKVRVTSGPEDVKMRNGRVPGKRFRSQRQGSEEFVRRVEGSLPVRT